MAHSISLTSILGSGVRYLASNVLDVCCWFLCNTHPYQGSLMSTLQKIITIQFYFCDTFQKEVMISIFLRTCCSMNSTNSNFQLFKNYCHKFVQPGQLIHFYRDNFLCWSCCFSCHVIHMAIFVTVNISVGIANSAKKNRLICSCIRTPLCHI